MGGARIIDGSAARAAGAEQEESDYIRQLRERSLANADANAAFVREKSLANGLSGAFGPFSSTTAVMKADGSLKILPISKYERLKDRGLIITAPSGEHMPLHE